MRADLRHTPAPNQFLSLFARYERTFQAFRSLRFSSLRISSDTPLLIRHNSLARLRAAAACLRLNPLTLTAYGLKPSRSKCTFPIYIFLIFIIQKKVRIYLSQTDADSNHINYRIKLVRTTDLNRLSDPFRHNRSMHPNVHNTSLYHILVTTFLQI